MFRKPAKFKLPVFTPPSGNNTLRRLAAAIPDLTSLPTLVVPRLHKPVLPTVAVTLPEVTIPSLFDVAPAFGVPTLPRLPPVFNMSFQDAVMQWMAAKAMNLQVPELRLHEQVIRGLQSLVDGFIAPALLVSNISLPLFQPPKGLNLPIIVLNHNQSSALSQVLPRLTALPTIVAPQKLNFRLPKIDLPTITVPNVADVISSLGATLTKWPKLPLALPGSSSSSSSNDSMAQGLGLSLTLPDLEALIRSKLPGNNNNNNVTGMQLPDALSSLQVEAPEEAAMPTPNFQFDFSGIQEIAAAIKAGLRGRLPQIEEVSIEKLIPADGDAGAVGTKSVRIDGVDVAVTPKVGSSSSSTTSSSTTVTTVSDTPAAAAAAADVAAPSADTATAATAAAFTPAAAAPAADAPAPAAAVTTTTVAPSVGSAGEVITETEVTVATPVPVDVAAPVPVAAAAAPVPVAAGPNQRVAGSSKASHGSTWGGKRQQ
uniref:Uncharacterized protein n=1 Tax=Tetradesmus obliquus TaxID=3088 RepID=A0A383VWU2_TETOB